MVDRLKRALETVLISSIVFVALDGVKRDKPADFRDALRDTRPIERFTPAPVNAVDPAPNPVAAPAPVQVTPPVAAPAAPQIAALVTTLVAAPASREIVIPKTAPVSDRLAYLQEFMGERDVIISKVYTDRRLARRSMRLAVKNLEAAGKRILFTSIQKETPRGDFYVIRLDNSTKVPQQVAAAATNRDEEYLKTLKKTADTIESTCRETWQ